MTTAIKLTAVSGGVTYNLSSPISGWVLQDVTGLGLVDVERLAQRSPGQPGDTDRGYNEPFREVELTWTMLQTTQHDLFIMRELLLGIFRPRVNDPVQLIFTLPHHIQLGSEVNTNSSISLSTVDMDGGNASAVTVILKASDPALYNATTTRVLRTALLSSSSGWDVAPDNYFTEGDGRGMEVAEPDDEETAQSAGWYIGLTDANLLYEFTYNGGLRHAAAAYPILRVYGPLSRFLIRNVVTGEVLDFRGDGGLELFRNEWIEVDLRTNVKTAVDQDGNSVEQFMQGSDLATWHIAYATELTPNGIDARCSGGVNIIQVYGEGATTESALEIVLSERVIGV